jgi:hypothetical protein
MQPISANLSFMDLEIFQCLVLMSITLMEMLFPTSFLYHVFSGILCLITHGTAFYNIPVLLVPQNGDCDFLFDRRLRRIQYLINQSKSKRYRKRLKRRRRQSGYWLSPQSGVFDVPLWSQMPSMGRIENLISLYIALTDVQTSKGFWSVLNIYYSTFCRASIFSVLCSSLKTTYALSAQVGEDTPEVPELVKMFTMAKSNWKQFITSPLATNFSNVVSLLVTAGLCEASSLDYSIGNVDLFSKEVKKKQMSATDALSAIVDTVTFFVEGGYMCFQKGSLVPLLTSDVKADAFLEEYNNLVAMSTLARTGNLLRVAGIDENRYDCRLQECIASCKALIRVSTNQIEKSVYGHKLTELSKIQTAFNEVRVVGGLRESPWCVGIYGGSGVGKTSVANILMKTQLAYNGFAYQDKYLVTLNEADKFMSNYRSYMTGVFIDDMGNTKPNFVDRAPSRLVIDLVNNVRMYANMADLDLKGKISVEPKVVTITKNPKNGGANFYSMEPASIARRERFLLKVDVKPQFMSYNQLDSQKVADFYGGEDKIPFIPDIWNIHVSKAYPIVRAGDTPADVGYAPLIESGNIFDVLQLCYADSKKHFAAQKNLVNRTNTVDDRMMEVLCPICKMAKNTQYRCSCEECDVSVHSVETLPFGDAYQDELEPFAVDNAIDALSEYMYDVNSTSSSGSESEDSSSDDDTITTTDSEMTADSSFIFVADEQDDRNVPFLMLPSWHRLPPGHWTQEGENCFLNTVTQRKHRARQRDLFVPDNPLPHSFVITSDAYGQKQEVAWTTQAGNWFEETFVVQEPRWARYVRWYSAMRRWLLSFQCFAGEVTVRDMYEELNSGLSRRAIRFVNLALFRWPVDWIERYMRDRIMNYLRPIALRFVNRLFRWTGDGVAILFCYHWWHLDTAKMGAVLVLFLIWAMFYAAFLRYMTRAFAETSFAHVIRQHRFCTKRYLLGACATLFLLMAGLSTWKKYNTLTSQGNLSPDTLEDIQLRDAESNPWARADTTPMPATSKAKSMTVDQAKEKIANNLCHMKCANVDGTGGRHCDALFLRSNVALIPSHIFKDRHDMKAKFVRKPPPGIGANFDCDLSLDSSYVIPGTDFMLCTVPRGGDWADITHLFPTGPIRNCVTTMLFKDEFGSLSSNTQRIYLEEVSYPGFSFPGARYTYSPGTFAGLCMATHVTDTLSPIIAGFHLAGKGNVGALGSLTLSQIEDAFVQLKTCDPVALSLDSGTLLEEQYGVRYYESSQIHEKSACRFLPEGSMVDCYGSVIGRAKAFSTVVKTPISDSVDELCGVPNIWGPPNFRQGGKNFPYQASLQYSANPAAGLTAAHVGYAYRDYLQQLCTVVQRIPGLSAGLKPLTDIQAVCGIDGCRFIDRLKGSTSPGFPLTGPKSSYFISLDPEHFPDFACPTDVDPMFWEEAHRMCGAYRRKERAYPIFKACLKDEATPIEKDKVRVFQSAPLAFQLLVRKYFLPIARVMSMNPLISECAVGINARSKEWEQMDDHILQYGKDRILAGDYSKYDLRMPAQLVLIAFKILINFAKRCGSYSEDDIAIMEGIATDIAYPIMAYNGDLIRLFGSNPSGHNLTVYINSIVNSLLARCAFFSMYGEQRFCNACALITYGDDFKGSVHVDYDNFNHLTFRDYLARHDLVLTMPNKSSEPTKYMHDDGVNDADFLKRRTHYISEIDCKVGKLDEQSIFKSLHAVNKSSNVSMSEVMGSVIDSALNEWFAHGENVYEERRGQLKEIAHRHGLTAHANFLEHTFGDMCVKWQEDYA